jgi:hypothetical protein
MAIAIPASAANYLYVNGNIPHAGQNAIYGYSIDPTTGALTALPGSPYLTGGAGVGFGNKTDAQWDSDNEVITNAAHTLMFATNGGSNTIAVFNINNDGTLTPVTGSPFPSMGTQPGTLALKENTISPGVGTLVVGNKNTDPQQNGGIGIASYTTFTVNANGSLTFNAGSTYNFPSGLSLGGVYPYPGTPVQVFGVEFMNATVSNYTVKKAGTLSLNSQSTPPAPKSGTPAVLGAAFNPLVGKNYLYVDMPVEHAVATYQFNNKGTLTYLRMVGNNGAAVCWSTTNAAGTRLITSETPSSSLTQYDISVPGSPRQVQRVTIKKTTGGAAQASAPTTARFDATGNFLEVLDRNGYIHTLNLNPDLTLTEVASPLAIGTGTDTVPLGMAVFTK